MFIQIYTSNPSVFSWDIPDKTFHPIMYKMNLTASQSLHCPIYVHFLCLAQKGESADSRSPMAAQASSWSGTVEEGGTNIKTVYIL